MAQPNSQINNIAQRRADFAYQCARDASCKDSFKKEYKSYVKKLPMLIKTNGLGAALAFVLSKEKKSDAWKMIFHQASIWLKHYSPMQNTASSDNLVKEILQLGIDDYRRTTTELMTLLGWMKRFAEGLIEEASDEIA